ncbi:MAG: hypothetical protein H8E26_03870 [FCB group bacterium]|nr:hypothetical protein [FCB group bacterium]MBL7028273.1 hypothetical protein [Candidatus Neomarinimicrobiota bacterium]
MHKIFILLVVLVIPGQNAHCLDQDTIRQEPFISNWTSNMWINDYYPNPISISIMFRPFQCLQKINISHSVRVGRLAVVNDYLTYRESTGEWITRHRADDLYHLSYELHKPLLDTKYFDFSVLVGAGVATFPDLSVPDDFFPGSNYTGRGLYFTGGAQVQLWKIVADQRVNLYSDTELQYHTTSIGYQSNAVGWAVIGPGVSIVLSILHVATLIT